MQSIRAGHPVRSSTFSCWGLLLPLIGLMGLLGGCGSSDSGGGTDPGQIFNRAPSVGEIQWNNPYLLYVDGDMMSLSVVATDADGDSLRYQWGWSGAAGGSYDFEKRSTVQLTVGSTVGSYQAQVTVSDGKTTITRSIGFTVAHSLGGVIASSQVWSAADSPYVIVSDVTVRAGVTLSIEPGVQLQLRRHGLANLTTGIQVEGNLQVEGTASAPISFSGNGSTNRQDVDQGGIEVLDGGNLQLRFFRMKQAAVGVSKVGQGDCVIEDGSFRYCGVGYQGLRDVTTGSTSMVTMRRVEIRDCKSHGINLNLSTAILEDVSVRFSGGVGLRITSDRLDAMASATVLRGELDSNQGGNLSLDGNSWIDLGCSNLIPAVGGKNVVLKANAWTPSGILPMTDCYWGLSDPVSEEDIRDRTFDGAIDANTWARDTDLSGYRSNPIDFNNPADPCNQ